MEVGQGKVDLETRWGKAGDIKTMSTSVYLRGACLFFRGPWKMFRLITHCIDGGDHARALLVLMA